MTSVIVYSNTVGKLSEYIKEEFVASNDGINFVRIPTRWSRSGSEPSSLDTVEDTFHVKFDRRKRGGDYAVWLPASNRSFVSTKGLEFMPAGEAGKVCGNSVGFGGTVVEIVLVNADIPPYKQANRFNHEPRRHRKLLLHRKQIDKLIGAVQRDGQTIIPVKLYLNEAGKAKIEIALAKGKKLHDKREATAQRDWQRDKARLMKDRG